FIIVARIFIEMPIGGYASLMVAVLVIGGVQMIMLGILGEYLWRTLEESRQRPGYFIEEDMSASDYRPAEGTIQQSRMPLCENVPGVPINGQDSRDRPIAPCHSSQTQSGESE